MQKWRSRRAVTLMLWAAAAIVGFFGYQQLLNSQFARAEEHAESDVDLLIIGNAGLAEIAPRLRGAERRVGRPVNPSVYTPREWARRRTERNHFVESVLGEPKLFILGGTHELETAA
jgi:hypothetical protein